MRHSARCPHPPRRRAWLAAALGSGLGAGLGLGRPALASQGRPGRSNPSSWADELPRLLQGCGLPAAHLGLCVAPVDGGADLAALNADTPFVLASTAKIVTSLAALELLGPRFRWRTLAFGTGPIEGGRLRGDLLIVGGGDPRLGAPELRGGLQQLRRQGLIEIGGDLVVDRSAFHLHEHDHIGTPPPGPDRPHHARPDALGGLSTPQVAGLWHEVGGQLACSVRELRSDERPAGQARLPLFDGRGELLLPLATWTSPPLPEVVREVNKNSLNLAARHLMLSLAHGFPLQAATLQQARERLHQWLLRQGVARGDIELDNGSGLSRAERGKPRAMVQLLQRAWASRESRLFVDSLPVAGVDGTLAHRLQQGAAMGQAFLKTGSLLDARALAGYVRTRSGRVLAVALFAHHPDAALATPAIDAVVERIARQG